LIEKGKEQEMNILTADLGEKEKKKKAFVKKDVGGKIVSFGLTKKGEGKT